MQTIFRAEICGRGETLEDAEIAWRRNVRRMMEAVRMMNAAYNAASDPRQETPWPKELLGSMSLLDRIENSHGGSHATSPPF